MASTAFEDIVKEARDAAERRYYIVAVKLYRKALALRRKDPSARRELRAVRWHATKAAHPWLSKVVGLLGGGRTQGSPGGRSKG